MAKLSAVAVTLALAGGLLVFPAVPCIARQLTSPASKPVAGGPRVECAAALAVLHTLPGIGIDPILGDETSGTVDCSKWFRAAGVPLRPVNPSDKDGIYYTLSRPAASTDGQASIDLTTLGRFPRIETYWLELRNKQWVVVRSETDIVS